MLEYARALGDQLLLVLSSDAHNRKPNAVPAALRLRRMTELRLADKVVIGGSGGFAGSLRRARPDILALGYDQRFPDKETEKAVRELGIEVVVMPWFPGKEEPDSAL